MPFTHFVNWSFNTHKECMCETICVTIYVIINPQSKWLIIIWLGYTILVIRFTSIIYCNPIIIGSTSVLNYDHLSRDVIFSMMRIYYFHK